MRGRLTRFANTGEQRRSSAEAPASSPAQTRLIFRSTAGRQPSTWTPAFADVRGESPEFSRLLRRSCRTFFLPDMRTEYPFGDSPSKRVEWHVRRLLREQTREALLAASGWPTRECPQPSARQDQTLRPRCPPAYVELRILPVSSMECARLSAACGFETG